jgi:HAD superfamily hydrolase (TIGR01549 family)
MKVLFWIPPWAAHGDPVFYRNCLKKHLAPQANLLASSGWLVDFVLPEFLKSERDSLGHSVNPIEFGIPDQIAAFGSLSDPSVELYLNSKGKTNEKVAAHLSAMLADTYEIILLWESPVPFLELMYPEALIVHQMPGAFSRAPYPHTVSFDPIGLYKQGSLYLNASEIQTFAPKTEHLTFTRDFIHRVRDAINTLQPFDKKSLNKNGTFDHLALLPLQVSAHYTFQADTKYLNQTDFLLDVLNKVNPRTGVVVTQYLTPRVSDTVLNKEILLVLQKTYPNLIYCEEFDRISGVSQYLLPLVDEVITCSSSIGLQALAWQRKLTVHEDTFLQPLATPVASLESHDELERALRILSFLLNHNQPLASSVVSDREFLTKLLLEMLQRKRDGARGMDLLPAFSDIDPDYSKKLLGAFMVERAERDLALSGERWAARQAEIGKFRRSISDSEVAAVTFDVFDTLIKRPTEVPADVYQFLERAAIEITHGIAEDFARVRLNAEVSTREFSEKGEITLEEIYSSIQAYYDLPDQTAKALLQAEIEMEVRMIQPRPFGQKCWEIAISSGKPIYLISDMYLSTEVIERMLQKAGYRGYKKLFLSSDYLARKKEGELFDAALREVNLPPSQILHVGDNKVADVEQAQARGMKTFRLLRAIDRMRGNDHYKVIYSPRSGAGERARSAIAGLTAHTLFDAPAGEYEKNSHFHGNPYHLGYAGLGPLLTGFMLWLGRQAQRDGISRLYFLSREGWILKQVYDALHLNYKSAVPSTYLYASRRATRVASLRSQGDVLALSGQPFRPGVMLGELLQNRFGLAAGDVSPEVLAGSGYSGWTDNLQSDLAGRIKFSVLCRRVMGQILEVSGREHQCYSAYLERIGFSECYNPGVVDIGWKGNMQGALSDLIGRPIHGYYYATLQGAEVWKAKGNKLWAYMGDLLATNHPSVVVANRHLVEYLTCHVESSLIRIERNGNELTPIFRSEENHGARRQLIEEVHQGCIQFGRDFEREYGYLSGQIWIDPFLGERVLASFITSPSKVDAALLLGHHFEDALGGVSRQYIIHPAAKRAARDSVWKQGAAVVHTTAKPVALKQGAAVVHTTAKPVALKIKPLVKFEHIAIRLLAGNRKYQKYQRDRQAFFEDSQNKLIRRWYQWAT